ncbi:pantoate--beta-alanine ligase [Coprobacter fastidiosus]|uniref:Pantothenate synthetase n=1 Tax=Coprobacter fastidiosus NSB1 = JCM 33896 TaxID=1349822 RepID=A0A495VLB1_9BACT|nr:pantoate--beta-alanine ligase [Coprobacter fastidiosus]RKT50124.1 pantoate--beta-alanine ligase [Coprobacter fastidiosus NSB1 = JCM 33896]
MEVVTKIADLQKKIAEIRTNGGTVGLVPTMGALHNGHLELVKRCVAENSICVVSVFVNPTQFNDKNDLLHYPRTLDADCKLLESAGCAIAFAPEVEEMYPVEDTRVFNLGAVAEVMEGKYRPGHFNGVAQIVSKLFDAVQPDRAYFGEKDFQQIAVIRSMVKLLNYPVEIVACPIVREDDGMALSSRNLRLTPEQRKNAVSISQTLFKSRTFAEQHSVAETIDYVVNTLNSVTDLDVEYFEIVNGNTLLSVNDWSDSDYIVGCITVYCGEVRLIDNIAYRR